MEDGSGKETNLLEEESNLKEKKEGGVNLINVRALNLALLAKKAWRIHNQPEILVNRLLVGKCKSSPPGTDRILLLGVQRYPESNSGN